MVFAAHSLYSFMKCCRVGEVLRLFSGVAPETLPWVRFRARAYNAFSFKRSQRTQCRPKSFVSEGWSTICWCSHPMTFGKPLHSKSCLWPFRLDWLKSVRVLYLLLRLDGLSFYYALCCSGLWEKKNATAQALGERSECGLKSCLDSTVWWVDNAFIYPKCPVLLAVEPWSGNSKEITFCNELRHIRLNCP